jgi:Zn-finger nucleic acid-binding protein
MNCPKCKSIQLKSVWLESDLPAEECEECKGVVLPLPIYRSWLEKHPEKAASSPVEQCAVDIVADGAKALLCPKCSGIMTKYRISSQVTNKVDLCVNCSDVCFDQGEWRLVTQLHLEGRLGEFFSEVWQLKIRRELARQKYEEKYSNLFGQDYQEVKRIKSWVESHPAKIAILNYINEKDPYHENR